MQVRGSTGSQNDTQIGQLGKMGGWMDESGREKDNGNGTLTKRDPKNGASTAALNPKSSKRNLKITIKYLNIS